MNRGSRLLESLFLPAEIRVCQSLSSVRLSVTPWTAACQVPLFLEFSRQEYWSGLPFPSPAEICKVTQSKQCMNISYYDCYFYAMLSHFSRVRLCVTPEMAAHQTPPSLGLSRQEPWSGLPFPSPMHESEKRKGSRSVVSTLSDPMDCSLPGSSIHGILQARALE